MANKQTPKKITQTNLLDDLSSEEQQLLSGGFSGYGGYNHYNHHHHHHHRPHEYPAYYPGRY